MSFPLLAVGQRVRFHPAHNPMEITGTLTNYRQAQDEFQVKLDTQKLIDQNGGVDKLWVPRQVITSTQLDPDGEDFYDALDPDRNFRQAEQGDERSKRQMGERAPEFPPLREKDSIRFHPIDSIVDYVGDIVAFDEFHTHVLLHLHVQVLIDHYNNDEIWVPAQTILDSRLPLDEDEFQDARETTDLRRGREPDFVEPAFSPRKKKVLSGTQWRRANLMDDLLNQNISWRDKLKKLREQVERGRKGRFSPEQLGEMRAEMIQLEQKITQNEQTMQTMKVVS
jgi:hypothetical protein